MPAENRKRTWSGRTGGGSFGQHFLFWALKRVKVVWLYPMLLFAIPFYCIAQYRAFKYNYYYFNQLHHFSKWKSFWKTIKNFIIFGEIVLDKFAVLAGNTQQFHINVKNNKDFWQLLDRPSGIVVAGSHVGNFELAGHCFSQDKKAINCVAFGGEAEVFKHQRIGAFKAHNLKMVTVEPDLSHLFVLKEALEKGEIVTIACDRVWGSRKTLKVDFLGKKAEFPLGPFILAARFNVPVAAVTLLKEKRTRYTGLVCVFEPDPNEKDVKMKSEELLKQYVHYLQKILQKYPEQWFNFFDFWGIEEK